MHGAMCDEQGGISFSTNQRFCLHFFPKPIRMRKTLHHMKFDNKHIGVTSELFCKRFFVFLAMKLIYVVLKRILLNFLVAIFD
jgi:hypothetical protein